MARFSANVLNAIYFGGTVAAGMTTTAYEAQSVPGMSTYTVTVDNSSHFTADLGVIYAATGLPLKRVSSVSAAGEYSRQHVDRRLHLRFRRRLGRRHHQLQLDELLRPGRTS